MIHYITFTCICGIIVALHRASTADAETGSVGPNIAITPSDNSLHAERGHSTTQFTEQNIVSKQRKVVN